MKFLPLIWAGIWRKPLRTVLMLMSVTSAFVLFGLLEGFSSGLSNAQSQARSDILITFSRVYKLEPLALGQMASILGVSGVRAVSPTLNLNGVYGEPGRYVDTVGVDTRQIRTTMPGMRIAEGSLQRLRTTRTGAVVSSALAATYGWKIGDRIPIRSNSWVNREGSTNWPLDVVGVFESTNSLLLSNAIICNYDYFDQGRTEGTGTVTGFLIRIDQPSHATQVARRIDALFANSLHETETSTELQLAAQQVEQIGDVGFTVSIVTGTVFASLLFSLGVVIKMSTRQRSVEFVILKTLGFTDGRVLALVLLEIGSLCVAAAALGLEISSVTFSYAKRAFGFAAVQHGPVFGAGIALAVAITIVVAIPSVLYILRLNIAKTLSGGWEAA